MKRHDDGNIAIASEIEPCRRCIEENSLHRVLHRTLALRLDAWRMWSNVFKDGANYLPGHEVDTYTHTHGAVLGHNFVKFLPMDTTTTTTVVTQSPDGGAWIYKSSLEYTAESGVGFEASPQLDGTHHVLLVGALYTVSGLRDILRNSVATNQTTWISEDGDRKLHDGSFAHVAEAIDRVFGSSCGAFPTDTVFKRITQELARPHKSPLQPTTIVVLARTSSQLYGHSVRWAFGESLARECRAESCKWNLPYKLIIWFTNPTVEAAFSAAMTTTAVQYELVDWSTVDVGVSEFQDMVGYCDRSDVPPVNVTMRPLSEDTSVLVASVVANKSGLVIDCRRNSDGALTASVPVSALSNCTLVIAGLSSAVNACTPFTVSIGSTTVPCLPWLSRAGVPSASELQLLADVRRLATPSTSFQAYYSVEGRLVGGALLNALQSRLHAFRGVSSEEAVEAQLARSTSTGGAVPLVRSQQLVRQNAFDAAH